MALFHHHTLQVALIGLTAITLYKLGFTGFKTGPGLGGLGQHMLHEWVILSNLLGLLLGFALLSKHFEESHVPAVLPRFLPDDWKGAFMLLVMIFVLSSFLDNIAAAIIGGTVAATVFRRKVHIGYLAAIVAASNAGGAGSVVGDTTTTMMWIDGVSPLVVAEAVIPAAVALVIFGIPAALQQHRHSPIVKDAQAGVRIDWARVAIVLIILAAAIVTNVLVNIHVPDTAGSFPFIGAAVWVAILVCTPWRKPDWTLLPEAFKGSVFLLALIVCASMMPVETLPAASWQTRFRPRLRLGGVRQHPAHRARAQAGRLRLGIPRLRRGVRRLDDLVRLQRGRGALEPVSRGEVGRRMAAPRLVYRGRLCRRLFSCCSPPSAGTRTRRTSIAAPRSRSPSRTPPFHIVKSPCGRREAGSKITQFFRPGASLCPYQTS